MKTFLICSSDESVTRFHPSKISADSGTKALDLYLKKVYSKDKIFRETVLDLSVNVSFIERFYLASDYEKSRFISTGIVGTEAEIVTIRIKKYFSGHAALCEKFLKYMETADQTLIDDEMFEFIATNETESQHGFVAIDLDTIPTIA